MSSPPPPPPPPPPPKSKFDALSALGLEASPASTDYVSDKRQFQLHHLVTEQRHPRTWTLSGTAREDAAAALGALLAVDEDVARKVEEVAAAEDGDGVLRRAVDGMKAAMRKEEGGEGGRLYFYGCGATGRLAKQVESSFWRPFWEGGGAGAEVIPEALRRRMADRCVGEMTGGDRALISSLEGLEDLQLVGREQLRDHGVRAGDFVMCVTEGGETSSVIGAVLAARELYDSDEEARRRVFFVFNNPEEVLRPLNRSRRVLDEPGISKVPLWTGPQAVAGSTRMQATTSETFLAGILMEQAIYEHLREEEGMSGEDLARLGFTDDSLGERLLGFARIQEACMEAVRDLARLTDLEYETYKSGGRSTYWAESAMLTVFTDSTERSPTFRVFPLDTVLARREEERLSWIRVVNHMPTQEEAWRYFLRREFKGMESHFYRDTFFREIKDPRLRVSALDSLDRAGDDQAELYDFSRGAAEVGRGDIGIVSLLAGDRLTGDHLEFMDSYRRHGGKAGAFLVSSDPGGDRRAAGVAGVADAVVRLCVPAFARDPLLVRQHVGLKMLLNAHSTCVMARLGRLTGNTMTNVSPANLKLVGRATYLILMHANERLGEQAGQEVEYAQANAVLHAVVDHVREAGRVGRVPEVALSVVLILEAFRRRGRQPEGPGGGVVGMEEALDILEERGSLENYLNEYSDSQ